MWIILSSFYWKHFQIELIWYFLENLNVCVTPTGTVFRVLYTQYQDLTLFPKVIRKYVVNS